jgi:hypothetical protein
MNRSRPTLETLEDRWLPSTSTITGNFNGTAIPAGTTLWLTSAFKVNGSVSSPVTLDFTNDTIAFTANGTNYTWTAPNAEVTISPSATSATTGFDAASNTWQTTLPAHFSGNAFLTGLAVPLPSGLPGGIKNVTWQGDFTSSAPGLSVNWQWAAAVYTHFGSDYNALNVKPVDDNHVSVYQNSDHAGTAEAFRAYVIGGATGGGGSNYTGSLSGTAQVVTTAALSSLSGYVYVDANNNGVRDAGEFGIGGVIITLTGTDSLGHAVNITVQTDTSGFYSFTGLQAGTYSITETQPGGYLEGATNVGSQGGTPSTDQISAITLNGGVNGINNNFGELLFVGS